MSRLGVRWWVAVAVVVLVLASCGSDTASSGADTGIEPQDPQLVSAGSNLYETNCASCHGSDLRGTDEGPSHLSKVYEPNHHGDGAFQLAVMNGSPQHHWNFGNMPPVTGLSEDDIEAIIAFVRENQRIEGFEPYPP